MISSNVETTLNAKKVDYNKSEIIIKDFISLEYIKGIIIPNNQDIIQLTKMILKKHNINIPIYDFNANILNNDIRNKKEL